MSVTLQREDWVVSWPVLWVAIDWIENHCVIPDGFHRGEPYLLADWQSWFFANHYRVRSNASTGGEPAVGAPAFYYRRSQIVMPQKAGKGPSAAAQCALEGVGPAMFAGWAEGGEVWDCRDHGCGCGWIYEYQPGEAMGASWPTPLIQITAYSIEQTGNVYDALRPMIEYGPLSDIIRRTGEEFMRLPGGGRIDTVTSSNQSRLGQRVTFVPQDEVGLWLPTNKMVKVAETQRRGASGMQGRVVETTNAWDPSEDSVAQRTEKASLTRNDIFRLHPVAPAGLSYTNKVDRRKIHRYVYKGCHWVNLDTIEGEAHEILLTDPAQAERFYGNRIVAGLGQWMPEELWDKHVIKAAAVPDGTAVAGGFDGSENDDWTAIRLETEDGFRFTPTYGPDKRPTYWNPDEWGGSIPRGEVAVAVAEIATKYSLRRLYCDPRDWRTEIGEWALKHGEEVVLEWSTYRIDAMFLALKRAINDLKAGRNKHDDDPVTKDHMMNARKLAKPGDKYILGKPDQHRKIDIAMADTLAHEAAADLHAIGATAWRPASNLTRVRGRTRAQ